MAPHCHQHLWCTTRHWDADHLVGTDPTAEGHCPSKAAPTLDTILELGRLHATHF